jgi:hypothetical protein
MTNPHDQPKPNHILVAVVTTSGTFPAQGFDEVPANQPVKVELARTARELHLTNTDGWVATVAGRALDVEKSYVDNHLTGQVEVQWGPPVGGGGSQS